MVDSGLNGNDNEQKKNEQKPMKLMDFIVPFFATSYIASRLVCQGCHTKWTNFTFYEANVCFFRHFLFVFKARNFSPAHSFALKAHTHSLSLSIYVGFFLSRCCCCLAFYFFRQQTLWLLSTLDISATETAHNFSFVSLRWCVCVCLFVYFSCLIYLL